VECPRAGRIPARRPGSGSRETLALASGASPDAVWLSVSDTGCGIPPEQARRIFEPFDTTKQTGSGLGLLIVQRILRAHGGRIELDSRVDVGTSFKVWIPLVEPKPRLLPERPAAS
jgi:signal transduction histidine kinase